MNQPNLFMPFNPVHPGPLKGLLSKACVCVAMAMLSTLCAAQSQQPSWPTKPVKLIVPFGAGAAPDVIARLLGDRLSQTWGQGVVIDNRAGAGGIPGMSALVRSPNDGYTLGFVPASSATITPLVFKNPQFNPETDLTPIVTVGISPLVLVTTSALGINSLSEMARFAKANPTKANFAAPQPNSLPHLVSEMVNKAGNMGMTNVPYQSPPAALAGLLGGDVVMTADGIPSLISQINSGRLKALAVTSAQRLPGLDIPTVAETYPGLEAVGWFQIIAPAGLSAAVVEKINQDVNRIINTPEMVARLAELGVYPRKDSPAAAREFFMSQQKIMKKMIAELGIQPQ